MASIFGNRLQIFTGNANRELAQRIADFVKVPIGKATVSTFPDGETFVRFDENIRGNDLFIVQPTCPPTNQNLMELLILVDAARRASAFRITAVLPFFGYARQDRKDQPRVPITAKLVANLLVAAGVNRVLAMDLHAQQIQGFFDIPVDHLFCSPIFYRHIAEKKIPNLTVVTPDIGGMKMAAAYAQMFNCGLAIVSKRRLSASETESTQIIGDVNNKNVLLVDDITETAGTLVSAVEILRKQGAKDVYVGIPHTVLTPTGIERIQKLHIKELITTNTTPQQEIKGVATTVLCVAPLLGEAILRIHAGESVSSLFEIRAGVKT
ncbi:MAG: ribose-phosphate pyrophosphokinase [Verrucomicrobia bacterium]|nr:ribose-phosphate pyrophosphokinase [Verrucomicrobiota bacterium]